MANVEEYRTRGDKGPKRYVARIRLKGFKPTSKTFPSRAEAEAWATTFEAELKGIRARTGVHAATDATAITIRQLIERFLADPVVSQLRWHGELSDLLAAWADEYGGVKVRQFGRIHVEAMRDRLLATRIRPVTRPTKKKKPAPIASLEGAPAVKPEPEKKPKTMSPARVNRYIAAMRRTWTWGIVKGYVLPSQPWPPEVMLSEPKPKPVYAEGDEIAAMFSACDAVAPELGSLVRFLVGTGCRLTDALNVTWRDVDEKGGDVAVRGQKTDHPLRVAMLAPARDAIARAKSVRNVSGRVFWQYATATSPQWHWTKAKRAFPEQMKGWRLHDCRHLCASLLAASGASPVELAAQLGHSTLQMVQRYAHVRGGHRGAAHDKVDKAFGRR
ncbi:MAG: site-specific integrase [Gammaproteobacteria bacterium]|nr:site-specific integrase [Gammaproteobacteria bacterium]